jgi:hypothetical protein
MPPRWCGSRCARQEVWHQDLYDTIRDLNHKGYINEKEETLIRKQKIRRACRPADRLS